MLETTMKIIRAEQRIRTKKSSLVTTNEALTTISKKLAETQAILENMLQDYQIVSEFSKRVIANRIEILTEDIKKQSESKKLELDIAEGLKYEIYDATEELAELKVKMEGLKNESLRTK